MATTATLLITKCPLRPDSRKLAYVTDRVVRVRTWTGEHGRLVYATDDGWLGVRLDGETRVDEWQPMQITRL